MSGSPRLNQLLSPNYRHRPAIGVSSMNAVQQERYQQILAEFSEIDANGDNKMTFKELYDFLKRKSKT